MKFPNKFQTFLFILLTGTLISCTAKNEHSTPPSEPQEEMKQEVIRKDTLGLTVLYPLFDSIDLVCGEMPGKEDKRVILVAEAAYTGELLKEFQHKNIAGDHVSGGKLYKGYPCDWNTGAFIYYGKKWEFCPRDYAKKLNEAAQNGGAAFGQELLIYKGKRLETMRKDSGENQYRALCNEDGKLCVVESEGVLSLGDFKEALLELGVSEALYLDMGRGWNHAWYRDRGKVVELHPHAHDYCTNWITFYTISPTGKSQWEKP